MTIGQYLPCVSAGRLGRYREDGNPREGLEAFVRKKAANLKLRARSDGHSTRWTAFV